MNKWVDGRTNRLTDEKLRTHRLRSFGSINTVLREQLTCT